MDLPTTICWPVIDEFFAVEMYASAQSSSMVCQGRQSSSTHAAVETNLLLQSGSILGSFDAIFAILQALFTASNVSHLQATDARQTLARTYPFGQQKTWEHGIDANLWALRSSQTFHQMETCRLGD